MPSRRLPLTTLHAFEAAARLGSFRTAAEELHVTPAAVSHRIKALERALGSPLFRRLPRGVALTEAGARYRDRIAEAFALIERATAEFDRPPLAGPLRLSVSRTFAQATLLPHLGGLLTRHPGLQLTLSGDDRPVDLHRGEAELAIRFGSGDYPGLGADFLMGDAISVVGPTAGAPVSGWSRARFIEDTGATAAEPWSHWSPWWQSLGLHETTALDRLRVSDSGLALAACQQGLGLCLARYSVAREALASGRLHALCAWRRTEFGYYLVGLPGSLASPRAHALGDWLREVLAPLAQELAARLAER